MRTVPKAVPPKAVAGALGNHISTNQQTLRYFVIELVQGDELRPFNVPMGLLDQAAMSKVPANWAWRISIISWRLSNSI